MTYAKTHAKAIVGSLIAGLTAIGAGLTDNALTPAEWIAAAVATLTAFGAVARVPNQNQPEVPPTRRPLR